MLLSSGLFQWGCVCHSSLQSFCSCPLPILLYSDFHKTESHSDQEDKHNNTSHVILYCCFFFFFNSSLVTKKYKKHERKYCRWSFHWGKKLFFLKQNCELWDQTKKMLGRNMHTHCCNYSFVNGKFVCCVIKGLRGIQTQFFWILAYILLDILEKTSVFQQVEACTQKICFY